MDSKTNQNRVFLVGFTLIVLIIAGMLVRPHIWKSGEKFVNPEEAVNAEILRAPLVSPKDLLKKMNNKEKILLFDVRSSDDFKKGHLAGAVNLSSGDLKDSKLASLEAQKTSDIVVLNQGSDVLETAKLTNELVAQGYVNTRYLQGGIDAWMKEGFAQVSAGGSELDRNKVKKINIETLAGDLAAGADAVQFLDVRSAESFTTGHIPGALNIELEKLERDQSGIPSAKKVVVYANDEGEVSQAAVILFDLNFFNVYVLEGGLDAWRAAGGQME